MSSTHPTTSQPEATMTSYLLSELPTSKDVLLYGLNFKYTEVAKKGLIGRFKGKKQAIDLDISCILYDKYLKVVDTVWFKQLRDSSSAIRHHGDSLNGKDRGDLAEIDRYADMETIEIRLPRIPDEVSHVALLLSSYYDIPINSIERGDLYISDDEGNAVHRIDLTKLDTNSTAILIASLSRELNEWRLTMNNLSLEKPDMEFMTNQVKHELSRLYPVMIQTI